MDCPFQPRQVTSSSESPFFAFRYCDTGEQVSLHLGVTALTPCVFFTLPLFAEYIQKYATEEALKEQEEGTGDSSSESSMSDFSEDEAQDMEL